MQANTPQKEPTISDPERLYASPRVLCEDRTLTVDRRIALLRQWEYDLRSIQVAAEENMSGATAASSGNNAELLSEVRQCLRALGDELHDEAATNKQGAGVTTGRKLPQ